MSYPAPTPFAPVPWSPAGPFAPNENHNCNPNLGINMFYIDEVYTDVWSNDMTIGQYGTGFAQPQPKRIGLKARQWSNLGYDVNGVAPNTAVLLQGFELTERLACTAWPYFEYTALAADELGYWNGPWPVDTCCSQYTPIVFNPRMDPTLLYSMHLRAGSLDQYFFVDHPNASGPSQMFGDATIGESYSWGAGTGVYTRSFSVDAPALSY